MSQYEEQIKQNTLAINKIITESKKINELQALVQGLLLTDLIAVRTNDGETRKATLEELSNLIGGILDIEAGSHIVIDKTNPLSPVISAPGSTTAGILSRTYFTGDEEVTTEGAFYLTNTEDRGTVASVNQVVLTDDDTILPFAQDILGVVRPIDAKFKKGFYSGLLAVEADSNLAQKRFIIEVYLADEQGVVEDSGITGAEIGSLGFELVSKLTSGIIDLGSEETVIPMAGELDEDFTIPAGKRTRIVVLGEKIGTQGGAITLTVYYGQNHNSYMEVPAAVTTDTVLNASEVTGQTATDAFNYLNGLVGGGGITNGKFTFDDSTSAIDPGKGKLKFNNADYSLVDEIYIDSLTSEDTDIRFWMEKANAGDRLLIQERNDANNHIAVELSSAPIDEGGWWRILCTNLYDNGAIINNSKLSVIISYVSVTDTDIVLFGNRFKLSKHPANNNPANKYILETNDMVRGYRDVNTFWTEAIYISGDINLEASYNIINRISGINVI